MPRTIHPRSRYRSLALATSAWLLAGGAVLTIGMTRAKAGHNAPTPEQALGAAYYTACAGCHGARAQGYPGMSAPALAGLSRTYVVRQLEAFRSGARGWHGDAYGAMMISRAQALPSAEAIEDVAAYIAGLPLAYRAVAAASATDAAAYAPCAGCHGDKAQGNPDLGAPGLAGRDRYYVERQLVNFKSGVRGAGANDPYGNQMRATAAALPDQTAIEAAARAAIAH